MIKIYEAANGLEAKLILDLLEQSHLTARIDGEYLQGGIGDLQAAGIVRVMIKESDYKQGKLLIEKWKNYELQEPPITNLASSNKYQESEVKTDNYNTSSERILIYISVGILGLLIGIFSTIFYYLSPIHESGIDYDSDGILDESWVYKGGRFSETRADRNLDKTIDLILFYNHKGLLESTKSDDNFDGVFETESKVKNGNWLWTKTDTTGDGFKNYRITFNNSVIDTISHYNSLTRKKVKTDKFINLVLSYSEIDTNGDGVLDSKIEYDEYENPIKTELK
jgi:hypothetical protein